MTLIAALLCVKSTGSIMAGTAEFAGVYVFHGYGVGALFHLEDLGMTVIAFFAGSGVNFAVKNDLACTSARKLNGFPRGDGDRGPC